MAKKIAQAVDAQTPHKDRLILIGLIAVLAFTIVNTAILFSNVALASTAAML